MSAEEFISQPISPRNEGVIEGMILKDYSVIVGEKNLESTMALNHIHPELRKRPDFLDGLREGVTITRQLGEMGYSSPLRRQDFPMAVYTRSRGAA